jgi:hypothetical protein
VIRFISTSLALISGMARRLPPFRPASIEPDIEQTLCLVRRYRKQREKAGGKVRVYPT